MKIESIRVQGFRSLSDLTFNPGAFTTLVGPNNAGKSNLVDALGFLSDVYAHSVKTAVDLRGGFENIALREDGIPRREISFEIIVSADPMEIIGFPPAMPLPDDTDIDWLLNSGRVQLHHRFTLEGKGDPLISEFGIEAETIRIDQLGDPLSPALHIERKGAHAKVEISPSRRLRELALPFFRDATVANDFLMRAVRTEDRPRDLVTTRLQGSSPALASLLERMGGVKTYQLLPTTCRIPSSATPDADLGRHGENLAALVYYLKEQFPEEWELVMHDMELILPDLEEIDIQHTTDRRWTLVFKETGIGRHWSADEVSDGTNRALALFSTIYDPRGSLLAIEEPENSIHPWILRVLVEGCRKVSLGTETKQIVLTTHAPILIDQLHPSEITVVWKEDGQTRLSPLLDLESNVTEPWADGKITLSGLLDSGLLRQTVPVSIG